MKTTPRISVRVCALTLSLTGVTFAQLTPEGSERRGTPKITICHLAKSDGFYEVNEVSEKSLSQHLRHGDCVIDDGVDCTIDICDPDVGCIHRPDDAACDDGLFCNGTEMCTPDGCAVVSACPPVVLECGEQVCDEDNDACVIIPNDADCVSGDPCLVGRCTNEGTCVNGPVPACSFAITVRCDDGNPCTEGDFWTVDICNNGAPCSECVGEPVEACRYYEAAPCDDGNACTQFDQQNIDSCTGEPCGECAGEPIPKCDDFDKCTADRCDPDVGCVHEPIDCDDGIECTEDSCDGATGQCIHVPNAALCPNDGNACTGEFCDPQFGCTAEVRFCDDFIECTTDRCDPETGDCIFTPDDSQCDDGDPCTTDYCHSFAGCSTEPVSCDDLNACTVDRCDPDAGCINDPIDCDDGIDCTIDNICDPVVGCTYTPDDSVCDDGIDCTVDSCDPDTGGCVSTPNDALCDDNNACTGDFCDPVEGCFGDAAPCSDGIECTRDACDPATGACVGTPDDSLCDDGIDCTIDRCDPNARGCVHTPSDALCDDNNACTSEFCDPVEGCIGDAAPCSDGIECTRDACDPATGACVGTPDDSLCDDGIDCTIDRCDPDARGCVHTPDDALCDDGIFCNGEEVCLPEAGGCGFFDCPPCLCESDLCGEPFCDEATRSCGLDPYPACGDRRTDLAPCDDGDPCTIDEQQLIDVCSGETCGPCTGTIDPDCLCASEGEPCVIDENCCEGFSCDTEQGVCRQGT